MARSTVTDLGEFYRAQGRKAERERIVTWLEDVDRSLAEQTQQEGRTDDERLALAGAHDTIRVLIDNLKAEG